MTRSLVLVVDDNDAGRLLARAVLQLAGRRADSDAMAKELLELLIPKPPITQITGPAADATTA